MQKIITLMLVFTIAFAVQCYANDVMTLGQALQLAYYANPDMQKARQEIKASTGRWLQAEALPNPEFEIEIGGFDR